MPVYSPRYHAALTMAARAHRNQVRKGTDIPYITHVVQVSIILLRYGFDEDIAIAGLLHDVIEDCHIRPETIADIFGEEVTRLVVAVSKPSDTIPWEEGRAAMIAQLEAGGPAVAALKAADAIHNTQSILSDLRTEGPAVWNRFRRGAVPTLSYYHAVLATVRRWLNTHPLADELEASVRELEAAVNGE